MANISVLMSVYNETPSDLIASIESVLNQTYKDFEFIIVNDNPTNDTIKSIITRYAEKDSRIKLVFNKHNLGLAASLNKAAKIANGEFYIRTDADDICDLRRFEKQYKIIKENGYDLVCSDYYVIDENGKIIDKPDLWYDSVSISKLLPFKNIIHHPTVIIRADSFNNLGGYRNFPCAQDYDLWLRMKETDCKFYMINEKLLYYRVRSNSISNKNRYKQINTIRYIRKLYYDKRKNSLNSYNYNDYLKFLDDNGVNNPEAISKFLKSQEQLRQGKKYIKNKKIILGLFKIIKGIISTDYYIQNLPNKIKFTIYSKILKMSYILYRRFQEDKYVN